MYRIFESRRNLADIVFWLFFNLVIFTSTTWANPYGGQVTAGQAAIGQEGATVTITQDTDRAVINWQDFSINSGETTKFIQPSSDSATLNRVTGFGSSCLNGLLTANGQVFLINPNGVVIGSDGRIETGGFFASTLDIPDLSFMTGGDLQFAGDSAAGISNLGVIRASTGDIILAALKVENAGLLHAPNGTAGLAAGSEVFYRPVGDERIFVKSSVTNADTPDGVINTGIIEAAQAELRTAGGNVYALAVNNGGAIHATGVKEEDGRVLLTSAGGAIKTDGNITAVKAKGDGGEIRIQAEGDGPSTITASGTLKAAGTASGARGGDIALTADSINITGTAVADASGAAGGGLIRIGGDYQGGNPDIYNAAFTTVGAGAEFYTDAITSGNGGRVIIWSDDETRFQGSIWARGGYLSGNGGFAEVSGSRLNYLGFADLRADRGLTGTLLLDPTDVYIGEYALESQTDPTWYLLPSNISTSLATSNVTVSATRSIFFNSGTISWNSGNSLNLNAASNNTANGGILISHEPGISTNVPAINGNGGLYLHGRHIVVDPNVNISAKFLEVSGNFDNVFRFDGQVTLTDYLRVITRLGLCGSTSDCPFTMTNSNNTIPSIIFGDGTGTAGNPLIIRGNTTIVSGHGPMSVQTDTSAESPSYFEGNLTILSKGDMTLTNYLKFDTDNNNETCILSTEGRFINNGTPLELDRGVGNPTLKSQFPYSSRMLIFSNDPRNDTGVNDKTSWWWSPNHFADIKMEGRVYNKTYDDLADIPSGSWFVYGITPQVTLTPADGSREYGDATNPALWAATGVILDDVITGEPVVSNTTTQRSNAGDYSITLTGTGTVSSPSGYTFVIDNDPAGTLSITKKDLYVHQQDTSRLYGGENTFTVDYIGLMDWDKDPFSGAPLPGVLSGMKIYAAVDIGNPGAGEVDERTTADRNGDSYITPDDRYIILRDATGFSSDNYNYVPDVYVGLLTINPAPLTITADNKIRRIGDSNPELTYRYTGFMDWDKDLGTTAPAGVFAVPFIWTGATVNSSSGNYTINVDGAWAKNYEISYVNGTLTVKEPYQLIITANDATKIYGEVNPGFGFSYSGWEDGDTDAMISGVTATTLAGDRSAVGTYFITPSGGTFPVYYTPLYVDGRLRITPRDLNIYAVNTTSRYGAIPEYSYTTDILAGDSLSTAPSFTATGRDVGTHTINVTGGSAPNYTIIRHAGTLTIAPAPLNVYAINTTMMDGESYPLFTADITGLMYNDTADVLQGLNLMADPAGSTAGENGMRVQNIIQSGVLSAANYSPIIFTPGVLTIQPKPSIELTEIKTLTVETKTDTTNYNYGWERPFGVPVEAADAMQYVARKIIWNLGLNVTDINAWMTDPSNRALMTPALFEFLKAPLPPGSSFYNQREIIKTALEVQIKEMKIQIARDAVVRYNQWKALNAKTHTRLEGLFGNLDTPPEDFVDSATTAYVGGALSIGALGAFAIAFGVGGTMSLALPASIAPFAASIAGAVTSVGFGASGIAAGAVLAIAGTVVRAVQLSEYQKVEDKYNNLVNDTINSSFDIDTMLNGDNNAQQQLFGMLLTSAATSNTHSFDVNGWTL